VVAVGVQQHGDGHSHIFGTSGYDNILSRRFDTCVGRKEKESTSSNIWKII